MTVNKLIPLKFHFQSVWPFWETSVPKTLQTYRNNESTCRILPF